MSGRSDSKNKKNLWIIVLIISLLLLIGSIVYYCVTHLNRDSDFDPSEYHTQLPSAEPDSVANSETVSDASENSAVESTEPLPDNPIDFESLWEVNPSVYAWINIPMGGKGKDIDYPILQSEVGEDDNFYLHNNIHKQYQFSGCIYTQKYNAKDFSDRVTVVYGHNMLDGTMFTNLVWFQDQKFFKDHDTFYIYTPGHILTYQIAAAIQFDDRHILNSFDFSDDEIYENWINNYILEPKTIIRSVREGIEVSIDDKIVILSTCLEHGAYRYLVQGVLISDEPTK